MVPIPVCGKVEVSLDSFSVSLTAVIRLEKYWCQTLTVQHVTFCQKCCKWEILFGIAARLHFVLSLIEVPHRVTVMCCMCVRLIWRVYGPLTAGLCSCQSLIDRCSRCSAVTDQLSVSFCRAVLWRVWPVLCGRWTTITTPISSAPLGRCAQTWWWVSLQRQEKLHEILFTPTDFIYTSKYNM